MKAPLEHLESSTPMSASEGGVYLLVAGAVFGLGALTGYLITKDSKLDKIKNEIRSEFQNSSTNRRESDRNQNPRKQPQKTNGESQQ